MQFETIKCQQFQDREQGIKNLLAGLNSPGKGISEKGRLAVKLCRETGSLLSCAGFRGRSQECKNCHDISSRRKILGELIIKKVESLTAPEPKMEGLSEAYTLSGRYI